MRRDGVVVGIAGLLALGLAGLWWVGSEHKEAPIIVGRAAAPRVRLPRPPPPWTAAELKELDDAVRSAAQEGLRPSDYKLAELEAAVAATRTGPDVDAIANAAALALAHDFAAGRISNRHRFNWYIDYAGPDAAEMARQIAAERKQRRLGVWLNSLLPTSAAYGSLRAELARVPARGEEQRNRVIANMERWRWLPRDFGESDQLYVNLPTYKLDVIMDGRITDTYRAVIGATDMPTPALSATVRQIIANPDWIVPASIVRKSHLRPGGSSRYIFSTRPDGTLRVRQKPGPGNALGRVKIEFPNKLAIYFHDTPSKSLFGASARAFSHGCVRVEGIETLANSIVARPDRFGQALAGTRTRSFQTARPWKANIVYLTLTPAAVGGLSYVGDPYHMDEALAAALQGRKPRRPAPPPSAPAVRSVQAGDRPTGTASPEPGLGAALSNEIANQASVPPEEPANEQ